VLITRRIMTETRGWFSSADDACVLGSQANGNRDTRWSLGEDSVCVLRWNNYNRCSGSGVEVLSALLFALLSMKPLPHTSG
jgi:hypothetical protein